MRTTSLCKSHVLISAVFGYADGACTLHSADLDPSSLWISRHFNSNPDMMSSLFGWSGFEHVPLGRSHRDFLSNWSFELKIHLFIFYRQVEVHSAFGVSNLFCKKPWLHVLHTCSFRITKLRLQNFNDPKGKLLGNRQLRDVSQIFQSLLLYVLPWRFFCMSEVV